ncbi:hypothetical protein FSP39_014852 [Pinctada imbricata]|uniref:TIMELESS-interacting protein n=1 Tax=Pinctada imbricata TaxID=66713 RepID=A0AA89C142_PINIB|nr:hypothetical protein FSP39_014852 [Pinctada imbricata]
MHRISKTLQEANTQGPPPNCPISFFCQQMSLLKTDKMESVNLDMEDIFDEQEEEDFPSVRPLPDLPDADQTEDQANGEDDENSAEVLSRLKDLSKGAAKKVVRKPQPKLDATRLTGERGIPVLPKLFEDVKFKGKGHEAQDLQIIMRYLEHWAHRLFPKMPFDEVLERIEKLGTKNEVKTCIKKMRLDMPVLNEDFIKNNDGEDDIDDNTDKNKQGDIDADAEEVFDEMMRAESESPASKTSAPRPTSHLATQLALPLSENPSDPMATGTPKPNSSNSQALSNGLTPEQRERMERNKRLAMEKRMNKHGPFKTPGMCGFIDFV